MDDLHIVSNNNEQGKKNSPLNKFLVLGGLMAIFIVSVGGGAYYVGRQSVKGVQTTLAPSVQQSNESSEVLPTVVATSPPLNPATTETTNISVTSAPISKNVLVRSKASLDGYLSSSGKIDVASDIRIGRNTESVLRGFLSFDLNDLPKGVQIQNATLRLYQTNIEGGPFLQMGALKIDHLNYGDSVDANDYAVAALSSGFATIPQSTGNSWKEIDVTARVKDDVANARSFSQFRIHFTTEKMGTTVDFISFESTENTNKSGNAPQLLVDY
jgi:hypothetical protein